MKLRWMNKRARELAKQLHGLIDKGDLELARDDVEELAVHLADDEKATGASPLRQLLQGRKATVQDGRDHSTQDAPSGLR